MSISANIKIEEQKIRGEVSGISMKQGDSFKISFFPEGHLNNKYDAYQGVYHDFVLEIKDDKLFIDNRVVAEITKEEPNPRAGKYCARYNLNWKISTYVKTCPCCGKEDK